ncbi:MAG TPA: alkaline phosphatase family protein, partial [Candidatus Cybelea sp.]
MAVGLALGACSGGSSPISSGIPFARHRGSGSTPIQHVVIVVQENRSFDNLFATFPGANGAKRGKEKLSTGDRWVKLKPQPLVIGYDLQHCHAAFLKALDSGKMDGFNLEGKGACPTAPLAGKAPYHYVSPADIAPYWDIADQWVLADDTFQTQGSGSFTAHQDLIRGGTCVQSCSTPSASTESL